MRRTKIVCTLGPGIDTLQDMENFDEILEVSDGMMICWPREGNTEHPFITKEGRPVALRKHNFPLWKNF